ncbi:MAG: hypothetical protein AVDCRST_MAG89-4127, partial [uncultured Gemmatimonadetes bacterium]
RPAERPHRHGPALSGGVELLRRAPAAAGQRHQPGERGRELLHLGGPVQHAGPGRKRAHQHRQPVRGAPRPQGREVGRPARPLPDGVLHQVAGRPHRRPERRLEGARPLGLHQHPHALPHGGREGGDQQGDPVPAAAGPAGPL